MTIILPDWIWWAVGLVISFIVGVGAGRLWASVEQEMIWHDWWLNR